MPCMVDPAVDQNLREESFVISVSSWEGGALSKFPAPLLKQDAASLKYEIDLETMRKSVLIPFEEGKGSSICYVFL